MHKSVLRQPFINATLLPRMRWLSEIALQLDVPVLAMEQYPKGLGYTVSALQEIIEAARVVEKTHLKEDGRRSKRLLKNMIKSKSSSWAWKPMCA